MKQEIFWWLASAAILVGLAVFGLAAFANKTHALAVIKKAVRVRFPKVRQLTTAELADWLEDAQRVQPLLLDVRQLEEFAVSHLPRAVQVDPAAAAPDVSRLTSANQPVVVYCAAGYRSSAFATRLLAAGFTKVFNLEGSIFAWANEHRPLERDGQPVKEVHPYNAFGARILLADCRAKASSAK